MWDFDGYIAKAKLYFDRADQLDGDDDGTAAAVWLLLGLEFLLRAPLAKVHASLLAVPEGDSILHANGIVKSDSKPKSVQTKTVVDRLGHVDPSFGQDRGKDALFLADLRNGELHTAEATLENASPETWMPKFLGVVEAVCDHLGMKPEDVLSSEIIERATAYRETADRAIRQHVQKAMAEAKAFYDRLTADEVSQRKASSTSVPAYVPGIRNEAISCVACGENTGFLRLAEGRTLDSKYDEDNQEITHRVVYLAQEFSCRVCGLALTSTAECMAAGIARLRTSTTSEDRYDGWEEMMTYEDAMRHLSADEYGND